MRLHRTLAAALIGSGLALLSTPAAEAESSIVVPVPSVATPGHAIGEVTGLGDAPFALVDLGYNGTWPGPDAVVPVEAGTAAYDLETWGLRSSDPANPELRVGAVPCTGPELTSCAGEPALSPVFQPSDSRPDVTWPTDTTLGPGQDVTITVDDPQGGGDLRATWVPDGSAMVLPGRSGTFEVPVSHGSGLLTIHRCMSGSQFHCDDFDPAVEQGFDVRRHLTALGTHDGAVTTAHPVATVTVDTDLAGSLGLTDVRLVNHEFGYSIAETPGDVPVSTDANGDFTFTIDPGSAPDGVSYSIVAGVDVQDAEFGLLSGQLEAEDGFAPSIYVDRAAPGIEGLGVSRTTIRPRAIAALSGYRSTVISLHDDEQLEFTERVEIRNQTGAAVRHITPTFVSGQLGQAAWGGRDDAGVLVPEGTYTAVVVDDHGNASPITRTIIVSHDTGVLRTFRRTVSAAGSKVDQYVGRCSTLRRPALRPWTGSLGFYANTRCGSTTWQASAVSTGHVLRLPSAVRLPSVVRHLDVRVDTYGGAARARPGSKAIIRYLTMDGWRNERVLGSAVGTHAGVRRTASRMIRSGGYLAWGFASAYGHRYDVKSFTVVVRYYAWS